MKKMIYICFLLNVEHCFASQNPHACDDQRQKIQHLRPQVTASDSRIFETYVGIAVLGEEWKRFIENYKESKIGRSKNGRLPEREERVQCCHLEPLGNGRATNEECAPHELVVYSFLSSHEVALKDDDIEVSITFAFPRNQNQKESC